MNDVQVRTEICKQLVEVRSALAGLEKTYVVDDHLQVLINRELALLAEMANS